MIYSTLVNNTEEIQQILDLQQQNLPKNISAEELRSQGFVTFQHDLETLQQFHQLASSVIVKDDEKVIAYALTVVNEARHIFPPMESMFMLLETLHWKNKPFCDYRYYEMGQICVAKEYRGKGVFEMLYQQHKKSYSNKYDLLVTEISTMNHRSLKAHKKIGFETIIIDKDELDEWAVVAWDWRK
ncbi:MAG TPA: GNAT family N-acetyltransferase [Chitinophagaceae bacterium]|nr:GNAT family N-acetyltransferase [Chitinophagaceae bacterium]